jgi:hypothetical protein
MPDGKPIVLRNCSPVWVPVAMVAEGKALNDGWQDLRGHEDAGTQM